MKFRNLIIITLLLAGLLLALPVSAGSVGDLVYNNNVAGGVFNGGFESGSGTLSTGQYGWIGSESYGWVKGSSSHSTGMVMYDANLSHSGSKSLKFIGDATGDVWFMTQPDLDTGSVTTNKYMIPVNPSTQYNLTYWTYNVGGTDFALYMSQYSGSGGSTTFISNIASTFTPSTLNAWVPHSVTFTSASNAAYIVMVGYSTVHSNVSYLDDITLEEVNTGVSYDAAARVKSAIVGVTSVDNIDQSLDAGGAAANTYALGTSVDEGATNKQTYTPTRSQETNISVYVTATGTGVTWYLVVHDASNNILASSSMIPTGTGLQSFTVPNTGASGNLHFHVYASATTGTPTLKAATSNDLETGSYIQYFSKNTENTTVTVNGNSTTLGTTDAVGLLSGEIVFANNGTVVYDNGFNATSTGKFSDVYLASAGGYTTAPVVINGWGWTNTAESIQSASDTTARNVTFKINSILPVTGLNITVTGFNNNVNTGLVELSGDGVTYTTVWDLPASASAQTNTISTGHVNGNTSIYLRLSKDTTNGYIRWDDLKVVALVNTSTVSNDLIIQNSANNVVNVSSNGQAVSSSLDPSMRAIVSLYVTEIFFTNSVTSDFTASNTSGTEPLLVHFTDTSTNVSAKIDSWNWSFGNGVVSSLQSPPDQTYTNGSYSVNLTITNTSYGLVSTKLVTITVYKQPVADFSSFNTAGTAPFTTRIFDTSTNLNAGPYTYYTDFGDGNTSTEEALYYNWNITGTYDVKHCITDSVTTACNNKTAYVTVGTAVVAPVASFYGGPQLGAPPLQVFFTDVSSNTPTSWLWEFGDGTTSDSQNPEKWYNQSGFYTVNLTATNTAGSNKTSQQNFVMAY